MADLALAVGRELELDEGQLNDLRRVAQLHDIGKVCVPRTILDRPGPLDEQEWQFIRQHTVVGERILAAAPALAHIATLVRSTHERYDGTGYPDQLAGREIPLLSRIVFACDAWDAMTRHERPYRVSMTRRQAEAELLRNAGSQFDPDVVAALIRALVAPRTIERPGRTGQLVS